MSNKVFTVCALIAVLAGCGGGNNDVATIPADGSSVAQPVQQAQAAAPVQQASGSSSTGDMLTGGAIGFMLGQMMDGNDTRRVETVHHYVPVSQPAPAPQPQQQHVQARPQPSKPVENKSTYVPTKKFSLDTGSSKPSYSAKSFGGSSFSSGSRSGRR